MSYADKWTDEQVEELEERIARLYSEAQKDFKKQADAYFAQFAKRDDEMRDKVESGEVSKEEYKQWRLTQMGRGERLNHMARQMAERATQANEVAVAYVNDTTPGIYSLNRNHEAYEIEKLGHEMVGADFSLYNEQAVRRIMVDDPDLMPYYPADRALKRGIDLAYGQQYIKRHITGGIIQGKSVYDIADDLQRDVANMNRASAVRTARTAMTAAQNGGKQATMDSARAMGIKLPKRWVSAKDAKVRDAHGAADGQTVDSDKPFIVGGERMMFPGDRTSASAWNIYNCRCTMRTVEKEGIEAEPRKVRIQNPAWTDAHEAEEKAKAKYEKALEKEKAETDPEKKKALRKARLEKQHEYEGLQQKRREIPKNMVVNDMTYSEWAKLRGLSSEKSLTSSKSRGKISSGAISGALNPDSKRAERHAERYYGLVRSMTTDIEKISKVSGFSEEEIGRVKNYVFYDEHDLGGEKPSRFVPNYMMGQSWQRLIDGKPEPHDITLIRHELMESELVSQGYSQAEAHIITSRKYNYSQEAVDYHSKIKKYSSE